MNCDVTLHEHNIQDEAGETDIYALLSQLQSLFWLKQGLKFQVLYFTV